MNSSSKKNSFVERLKHNSEKRRKLLAKQFGLTNPSDLTHLLGYTQERAVFENEQKHALKHIEHEKKKEDNSTNDVSGPGSGLPNDEDEMTYTESTIFLKGTQSANPHNDYCQYFVDTNQRPQNFIRDVGMNDRFVEFPKLSELIKLKDELVSKTATPPMYLKCDLRKYDLENLKEKFDVILIEPPLEDYQRTNGVSGVDFYNWDEIMRLKIEEIAAQRAFIFLWCGSGDGLDYGRQCLRKWGFRRCEDICWIKSNKNHGQKKDHKHNSQNYDSKSIFQRTKEHCLMGIKGTVRRSIDGSFIHANVDIDLIITEEFEYGSLRKPDEIFYIIEHFCLGRRRLHLFGRDDIIRPGWLSVGPALTNSNYNTEVYSSYFSSPSGNGYTTGCTERIEQLRPKSPPPKGGKGSSGPGQGRSGLPASGGFSGRNGGTR